MRNAEAKRLQEKDEPINRWEKWGPYVSERSWGTVREDYSGDGNAWAYFPHAHARFRAYRWGEDGIAGICDRFQVLSLSFAFWNEKDPFLKERLFGLDAWEGNHGEDCKEYYFYLDNTPTHSYMKYLYKYPQQAYPYEQLVEENKNRSSKDPEYELIDTGAFQDNRYFDIFVEYAKNTPEDIVVCVEIINRASQSAPIHLLPQLTFRNNWSYSKSKQRPKMTTCDSHLICDDTQMEGLTSLTFPYKLGKRYLYSSEGKPLITENDTNAEALKIGKNPSSYTKDAFHRYIVNEEKDSVKASGTKGGLYHKYLLAAGESKKVYFRFTNKEEKDPLDDAPSILATRKKEADQFFESLHPKTASVEEKAVQRQAFAGMLWSKQIYLYNVAQWVKGDGQELPEGREKIRNLHWRHLVSKRVMSMPDKWEYPWFAAWDLAFQCITLALVDLDFAKEQLWLLLFDQFQHPNGQVPAYEWEFSDLNPPVQAWACFRLYTMEAKQRGKGDRSFLKRCFHKLILNFVWWVNKVDSEGNSVFEGGFLGLDNITVFDRSEDLPGGGRIEQSDGTGWMGLFCLNLMRISLELAKEDKDYEPMATKFFEHYVYIASALQNTTNKMSLWNEEDGFFYDVVSKEGERAQIMVRSLVGIIPLFAVDSLKLEELEKFPTFYRDFTWFLNNRPDLCEKCITPVEKSGKKMYLMSLMHLDQMKKVLTKVWDPKEFRSDFGLRSLSKHYEKTPYSFMGSSIQYEPGESVSKLKGGNSNWRGPIWLPTTFLFIESLRTYHSILGDDFTISGDSEVNLKEMAQFFAKSVINIFKADEKGHRPVYGDCEIFQKDPHFQKYILFYEHFHGDTGRGLGASHQTGWTGLVANLIDEWSD